MTSNDPDKLYDRYLDACLSGEVESPEAFCERHGVTDTDLTQRLRTLYDLHRTHRERRAEPAAGDRPETGLPFERLGEFLLIRKLGEGGMGTLFLATQKSLGRRVAVKVVRADLRASPTAIERFRREALAVARLRHPNIVSIFATGEQQGVLWLAMDLVPGRGLDELIEEARRSGGALGWRRVAGWAQKVAEALAGAHDSGILHRDVKPANIRITPEDEPILVDFGLARDERWSGQSLTQAFAGSPLYAAPEQLAGRELDGRVDVYALGVTLYEALCGRLPFPEGPADQLLHRVLFEEPLPPRRLEPDLPRDLEVVVLAALEKSPRDRYADAASFAADLEAVLDDRPVAARPPGPVGRLRRWAGRRPWPAAFVTATIVALLLLAGLLVVQRSVEHASRRKEARSRVTAARGRLGEFRKSRESLRETESRVTDLQTVLETRYMSEEEDRHLDRSEDAVARAQREREVAFYEALEHLRRAQELDPDVEGAEDLRAEIYLERWKEARAARDAVTEGFYRDLVLRHDRADRFRSTVFGECRVKVVSVPPGATVHVFRLVEQAEVVPGGEHRVVPVPRGRPATPAPPGAFAVRVVRGAGRIRAEDLLLEVAGHPVRDVLLAGHDAGRVRRLDRLIELDGRAVRHLFEVEELEPGTTRRFTFAHGDERIHVEAESLDAAGIPVVRPEDLAAEGGVTALVCRDGKTWRQVLPTGLEVRTTAAPLFPSEACLVGTTPTTEYVLPAGYWLHLIRKEGYRPLRYYLEMTGEPPQIELSARLIPLAVEFPGFVPVWSSGASWDERFWIMEREVTSAEYLEFLNDPETLRRIDEAGEPTRFPRDGYNRHTGGYWPRREDGRYELGEGWAPDLPALAVSWHDAKAFAEWRTQRARRRGERITFRLPTRRDWDNAGCAGTNRDYPFGNRFRPKWMSSCFSQRNARPQPVLRYPIDESPFGVYDMAGSAREWLEDWYDEGRGMRFIAGGSWAHARPKDFELWGDGMTPEQTTGAIGFRLVIERDAE